jgi:hypothetical protein
MWHSLVWIGGIWLVATIIAWLACRWRGYNVAAWSVTIIAFWLGLFICAENSPKGRFQVPFLSGHHYRHLTHHAKTVARMVKACKSYRSLTRFARGRR